MTARPGYVFEEGQWQTAPDHPSRRAPASPKGASPVAWNGALPHSVTAAELRHKIFAPIRWAVPDIVADGLTLLAGKPKLGKSWLVLDIAISIAAGGYTLGDRHCPEGDVLYCALEDGERRLKSRLERRDRWPDRVTFWTKMEPLERGGLDQLRAWCESVPDPRFIAIDTFAKVRSPKGREEQQYDADYRQAGALKAFADTARVSLMAVHHTRKMAADDPLESLSGTNGLTGAADTILVLGRTAEGVTLYGRGRDVEEIELAIQFQRDAGRWSVLGDATDVRRSAERQAILDALRSEGEAMTPLEIANVTGQSRGGVRQTVTRMAREGELKRVKRGQYGLA